MLAKYKGICSLCGNAFDVGEAISWSRQEGGKAYHIACKAKIAVPAPVSSVPVAQMDMAQALAALTAILTKQQNSAPVSAPECAPVSAEVAVTVPITATASVTRKASKAVKLNSPWYEVLDAVIPICSRILIIGPPSTGKSTTAMLLANTKHRTTMTETTSTENLIGQYHLIEGETKFMDGPFTIAARNGEKVLVDEVDRHSPEAESLFYGLIDDRPHINLPTGEYLEAKEGYGVIMTTNESIETLTPAVQDRVEVTIFAQTPHENALAGFSDAERDVCMRYYEHQPKRTLALPPTVRRMRTFRKLIANGIPSDLAGNLVFGEQGAREVLSTLTSAEGRK